MRKQPPRAPPGPPPGSQPRIGERNQGTPTRQPTMRRAPPGAVQNNPSPSSSYPSQGPQGRSAASPERSISGSPAASSGRGGRGPTPPPGAPPGGAESSSSNNYSDQQGGDEYALISKLEHLDDEDRNELLGPPLASLETIRAYDKLDKLLYAWTATRATPQLRRSRQLAIAFNRIKVYSRDIRLLRLHVFSLWDRAEGRLSREYFQYWLGRVDAKKDKAEQARIRAEATEAAKAELRAEMSTEGSGNADNAAAVAAAVAGKPMLYIHLIEGHNLSQLEDKDSKSVDAFVTAEVGEQSWKSQVIKKNDDPKWDEKTVLAPRPIPKGTVDNPNVLRVTVTDWDRFGSDDPLGSFTVPFKTLENFVENDLWFVVPSAKSGIKGQPVLGTDFRRGTLPQIRLKLTYSDAARAHDLGKDEVLPAPQVLSMTSPTPSYGKPSETTTVSGGGGSYEEHFVKMMEKRRNERRMVLMWHKWANSAREEVYYQNVDEVRDAYLQVAYKTIHRTYERFHLHNMVIWWNKTAAKAKLMRVEQARDEAQAKTSAGADTTSKDAGMESSQNADEMLELQKRVLEKEFSKEREVISREKDIVLEQNDKLMTENEDLKAKSYQMQSQSGELEGRLNEMKNVLDDLESRSEATKNSMAGTVHKILIRGRMTLFFAHWKQNCLREGPAAGGPMNFPKMMDALRLRNGKKRYFHQWKINAMTNRLRAVKEKMDQHNIATFEANESENVRLKRDCAELQSKLVVANASMKEAETRILDAIKSRLFNHNISFDEALSAGSHGVPVKDIPESLELPSSPQASFPVDYSTPVRTTQSPVPRDSAGTPTSGARASPGPLQNAAVTVEGGSGLYGAPLVRSTPTPTPMNDSGAGRVVSVIMHKFPRDPQRMAGDRYLVVSRGDAAVTILPEIGEAEINIDDGALEGEPLVFSAHVSDWAGEEICWSRVSVPVEMIAGQGPKYIAFPPSGAESEPAAVTVQPRRDENEQQMGVELDMGDHKSSSHKVPDAPELQQFSTNLRGEARYPATDAPVNKTAEACLDMTFDRTRGTEGMETTATAFVFTIADRILEVAAKDGTNNYNESISAKIDAVPDYAEENPFSLYVRAMSNKTCICSAEVPFGAFENFEEVSMWIPLVAGDEPGNTRITYGCSDPPEKVPAVHIVVLYTDYERWSHVYRMHHVARPTVNTAAKAVEAPMLFTEIVDVTATEPKAQAPIKAPPRVKKDKYPPGKLEVTIVSGSDLAELQTGKSVDPYVVLYCGGKEFKTEKKKDVDDAKWNVSTSFSLPHVSNRSNDLAMKVGVYDYDRWSKDDILSSFSVRLEDHEDFKERVLFYKLQSGESFEPIRGSDTSHGDGVPQLCLRLKYTDEEREFDLETFRLEEENAAAPALVSSKPMEPPGGKKVYSAHKEPTLKITLVEGRDLNKLDKGDTIDPIIAIWAPDPAHPGNDQHWESNPVHDVQSLVQWDGDGIEFRLPEVSGHRNDMEVVVKVIEWDRFSRNDILSSFKIRMEMLEDRFAEHKLWFKLEKEEDAAGILRCGSGSPFQDGTPQLCLSLTYHDDHREGYLRANMGKPPVGPLLVATLHSIQQVVNLASSKEDFDCYVVASVGKSEWMSSTKERVVAEATWGDAFHLEPPAAPQNSTAENPNVLSLKVYQRHKYKKDTVVGSVSIPFSYLEDFMHKDILVEVNPGDNATLVSNEGVAYAASLAHAIRNDVPMMHLELFFCDEKRKKILRVGEHDIDLYDGKEYHIQDDDASPSEAPIHMEVPPSKAYPTPRLYTTVLEAINVNPLSPGTPLMLYLELALRDESWLTSAQEPEHDGVRWNENTTFNPWRVPEGKPNSNQLVARLHHVDSYKQKSYQLGAFTIPLTDLEDFEERERWYVVGKEPRATRGTTKPSATSCQILMRTKYVDKELSARIRGVDNDDDEDTPLKKGVRFRSDVEEREISPAPPVEDGLGPADPSDFRPPRLYVTFMQGANLNALSSGSSLSVSPYMEIVVGRERWTSTKHRRENEGVWNESCTFNPPPVQGDVNPTRIVVRLFDQKAEAADECIGAFAMPMSWLEDFEKKEAWFVMSAPNDRDKDGVEEPGVRPPRDGPSRSGPSLLMRLHYVDETRRAAMLGITPHESETSRQSQAARSITPSPPPPMPSMPLLPPIAGPFAEPRLYVTFVEGLNLKRLSNRQKVDVSPYIVVRLNEEEWTSSTKKDTTSAAWKESFTMNPIKETDPTSRNGQELVVTVLDSERLEKDPGHFKHHALGAIHIPLAQLEHFEEKTLFYPINRFTNQQPVGTTFKPAKPRTAPVDAALIRLKLRYLDDERKYHLSWMHENSPEMAPPSEIPGNETLARSRSPSPTRADSPRHGSASPSRSNSPISDRGSPSPVDQTAVRMVMEAPGGRADLASSAPMYETRRAESPIPNAPASFAPEPTRPESPSRSQTQSANHEFQMLQTAFCLNDVGADAIPVVFSLNANEREELDSSDFVATIQGLMGALDPDLTEWLYGAFDRTFIHRRVFTPSMVMLSKGSAQKKAAVAFASARVEEKAEGNTIDDMNAFVTSLIVISPRLINILCSNTVSSGGQSEHPALRQYIHQHFAKADERRVTSIVDTMFRELNKRPTEKVSFSDFCQWLRRHKQLMEWMKIVSSDDSNLADDLILPVEDRYLQKEMNGYSSAAKENVGAVKSDVTSGSSDCTCGLPPTDEMIQCGNPTCGKWYHLGCVGLSTSTWPTQIWYCVRCTARATPEPVTRPEAAVAAKEAASRLLRDPRRGALMYQLRLHQPNMAGVTTSFRPVWVKISDDGESIEIGEQNPDDPGLFVPVQSVEGFEFHRRSGAVHRLLRDGGFSEDAYSVSIRTNRSKADKYVDLASLSLLELMQFIVMLQAVLVEKGKPGHDSVWARPMVYWNLAKAKVTCMSGEKKLIRFMQGRGRDTKLNKPQPPEDPTEVNADEQRVMADSSLFWQFLPAGVESVLRQRRVWMRVSHDGNSVLQFGAEGDNSVKARVAISNIRKVDIGPNVRIPRKVQFKTFRPWRCLSVILKDGTALDMVADDNSTAVNWISGLHKICPNLAERMRSRGRVRIELLKIKLDTKAYIRGCLRQHILIEAALLSAGLISPSYQRAVPADLESALMLFMMRGSMVRHYYVDEHSTDPVSAYKWMFLTPDRKDVIVAPHRNAVERKKFPVEKIFGVWTGDTALNRYDGFSNYFIDKPKLVMVALFGPERLAISFVNMVDSKNWLKGLEFLIKRKGGQEPRYLEGLRGEGALDLYKAVQEAATVDYVDEPNFNDPLFFSARA